jgi:hypothetical protein
MYLVVPPKIEKHFLFLSPYVTARDLPKLLHLLTEFGISVLDIQKINYEKLQYEGEPMASNLNKNLCLFKVRGSILQIPIGFVLKVAREGLVQSYIGKVHASMQKLLDAKFPTEGGLVFLTSSEKEYKLLRQKVRQNIFNVNYSQLQLEHLKPKSK